MTNMERRLVELDIYCSGQFHELAFGTGSVFSFVRMRRPPPDPRTHGLFVVYPGCVTGQPEVSFTVYGRDGKPVWRFADGKELFDIDAVIAEIDKRLPPLQPKEGAD